MFEDTVEGVLEIFAEAQRCVDVVPIVLKKGSPFFIIRRACGETPPAMSPEVLRARKLARNRVNYQLKKNMKWTPMEVSR